jgi:mycothiol synthase
MGSTPEMPAGSAKLAGPPEADPPTLRAVDTDLDLTWHPLAADDLARVASLAGRCLAADGGLPLVTAESFVARRYGAPGGIARGASDAAGRLVAGGAVRPQETAGVRAAVFTGLVDPARRGRGLGGRLLDWGLSTAAGMADSVTVETEALTDSAARLFAGRGLHQVFAEDVMRFDLAAAPVPPVALPEGIRVEQWTSELADRFFGAYEESFRDRPGFPGWSTRQWIDWTADDEDFRPHWSLLAVEPHGGDVGFITCADGWIVQVGVRPDRRGRRLGAALVAEALRRMGADGLSQTLLDVNVDNPAGGLYERLGFVVIGRRARFQPAG